MDNKSKSEHETVFQQNKISSKKFTDKKAFRTKKYSDKNCFRTKRLCAISNALHFITIMI
jgi:hypothetical protein